MDVRAPARSAPARRRRGGEGHPDIREADPACSAGGGLCWAMCSAAMCRRLPAASPPGRKGRWGRASAQASIRRAAGGGRARSSRRHSARPTAAASCPPRAPRAVRVSQLLGVFSREPVDQEVGAHLAYQVLELYIARMHQRNFQPVDVKVSQARTGENTGGAVVVRMNVGHDEAAQPLGSDVGQRILDHRDRFVGVHAAVDQVSLASVGEEEHVDSPFFEWNRQAELEDSLGHLRQSALGQHLTHCRGLLSIESLRRVAQEERMSEEQMSPDQIIEALPKYLIAEKAGSTKATIQFDLSGDGGGKWWMKIHDGVAESGKGEAPEPASLTMLADAGDWVKIAMGKLDGTAAFMQGKLKIKGDMGLAIKYQSLFKRPT